MPWRTFTKIILFPSDASNISSIPAASKSASNIHPTLSHTIKQDVIWTSVTDCRLCLIVMWQRWVNGWDADLEAAGIDWYLDASEGKKELLVNVAPRHNLAKSAKCTPLLILITRDFDHYFDWWLALSLVKKFGCWSC